MAKWQHLFIPLLACVILMFSGIFRSHTSPLLSMSGQSPKEIPPDRFELTEAKFSLANNETPETVLDRSIRFYDPANIQWLHLKLWQRGDFAELTYRVEGEFWFAPEYRMRMKMSVHHGSAESKMDWISDGMSLYEGTFYNLSEPDETWTPFTASGRYGDRLSLQHRKTIINARGYPSIYGLLNRIRKHIRTPTLEAVRHKDKDFYRICGKWPKTTTAKAREELNLPFNIQVEECRIYLERSTFWPYRIEWWGRESEEENTRLILQTEYRDPVVNQELTAAQIAELFTVPPLKEKD